MASNLSDGVGKKIVDALRQQSQENASPEDVKIPEIIETQPMMEEISETPIEILETPHFETPQGAQPQVKIEPTPVQNANFETTLDTFEVPSNVAVLRNLISQLPTGVSKQMGAQIIKQTMEALGISMKSVLQEAQQLQQSLNNATSECQATIQEYKNNIVNLEKQAQNNQRQYSALNDLISLFIQTGR